MAEVPVTASRGYWLFVRWVVPSMILATLVLMLVFTRVPLNLWAIRGSWADAVVGAYIVAVVAVTFTTDRRVHAVASGLSMLTFVGRGGGFLHLVLDGVNPRYDLLTAVCERLLLGTLAFLWHWTLANRAGVIEERRRARQARCDE